MSIAICGLKQRNDLKAFPQLELEQINFNTCIKILTSFSEVILSPPLCLPFLSLLQQFSPLVEAPSIEVSDTEKNKSLSLGAKVDR